MTRLRPALALCLVMSGCAMNARTVGASAEALTYPNDQPAYDYFIGKGLTDFQAAGIVGNLDVESGVDPTAVESGGPGRGIAQWSVGARWDTTTNDNAVWFAGTLGEDVETLEPQLAFIWYELSTFSDYGLAALQATTNVTDATIAFMTNFEVCGACASDARVADAENVLTSFGGTPIDLATPGTSCALAGGELGQCIDQSICAAMPGYLSTPGLCPGASNIQCCTATASPADGSVVTGKRRGGCDLGNADVEGAWVALLALLCAIASARRCVAAAGSPARPNIR